MKTKFQTIFRSCRSESGSVTIEFAAIGSLLLIAILGTFELGRVLYTHYNLETAVGTTTRLIQLQAPPTVLEEAVRSRFSMIEQQYITVDVNPTHIIDGVTYTRIEARYDLPLIIPNFNIFSGNPYIVEAVQLVPMN